MNAAIIEALKRELAAARETEAKAAQRPVRRGGHPFENVAFYAGMQAGLNRAMEIVRSTK